ncbi:hypothetical protein CK203_109804 [Vitis vinifera]|uniref:Retrotransposon gag domain-containing protein n=1 Tax=Vitis vinifera TaxID=29760 RepID=A0A438FE12_VITVI|nr:hypothetical protein CK203_109804 [Vitis vinifera]
MTACCMTTLSRAWLLDCLCLWDGCVSLISEPLVLVDYFTLLELLGSHSQLIAFDQARGLLTETDLGSRAWIRIRGRLVRGSDPHSQLERISDYRDMDPRLGQRIDGHQAPPAQIPGSTPHDSTHLHLRHRHLDPLYSRTIQFHHHLFSQPHGLKLLYFMDLAEDQVLHVSDGVIGWDGYDDLPVATLPVEFRMPDIERPDEVEMIMLFPMSLSGAAQRWFASLDPSRHRTWADLGQEFIRQYSFNTELEPLEAGHTKLKANFAGYEISLWLQNGVLHAAKFHSHLARLQNSPEAS